MQLAPLNELIAQVVDEFVSQASGPFDKDEVVTAVLEHPEIRLMRKGLDAHDRSEGLEDVFLRDVRKKVGARLKRDQCVATPIGGGKYRWHPPERR